MVAHNQHFDFFVLNGLQELTVRKWELKKSILENSIFVLSFRKDKSSIIFVDTLNYLRAPLSALAKAVGLYKEKPDFETIELHELSKYCKNDVEILKQWFTKFIDFCRNHDLGWFGVSTPACAFNAYRHRFMTYRIAIHANPLATQLERKAYRGARVECFRIGTFSGETFYELDINSMYPYLMKTFMLPYKLRGVSAMDSVEMLRNNLEHRAVIADVKVEVPEPAIAVKKNKLIFPIGSFRVTLTTPELKWVLRSGKILRVYAMAFYDQAVLFREFVDEFFEMKVRAERNKNVLERELAKLFMNSLYGKFGQRVTRWELSTQLPTKESWIERYYDLTNETWVYSLVLQGKVYRKGELLESRDSFTAIPAHLTAYGRLKLFDLIQQAKRENVYYCDTDALIVNEEGFHNLENRIDPEKLGYLKLYKAEKYLEIRGCKDYTFGKKTRRKGIRENAIPVGYKRYRQDQLLKVRSILKERSVKGARRRTRIKDLSQVYDKGILREDGRVDPFYLSE